MNRNLIDKLLYEDESTALDFKRDQYLFNNASKDVKSELLKDIIAFANSWRRSDAYILIGVKEVKGDKSIVVGISKHLEDSILQQFVNNKTNRQIDFSYQTFNYDGLQIGAIHIPLQKRPFFLNKEYGKLHKEKVYYRRGSSTGVANPDEIAKMGQALAENNQVPKVSLEFGDGKQLNKKGVSITLNSSILKLWETIPLIQTNILTNIVDQVNQDFYREYFVYLSKISFLQPVGFVVANVGEILLENVVIRLKQPKMKDLEFVDISDYPEPPQYSGIQISNLGNFNSVFNTEPTTTIFEGNEFWEVSAEFGNIQPKADKWSKVFYIGSTKDIDLNLEIIIYADNLRKPLMVPMNISIFAKEETVTAENIIIKANGQKREE